MFSVTFQRTTIPGERGSTVDNFTVGGQSRSNQFSSVQSTILLKQSFQSSPLKRFKRTVETRQFPWTDTVELVKAIFTLNASGCQPTIPRKAQTS